MIRNLQVLLWVLISFSVSGQKFMSERGFIKFYSQATIEDITARNEKATALFDAGTGSIAFVVPINKFEFAKSLMKEHFNEKYLESERYPKSTFQGRVIGYNPETTTEQSVTAQGKLTIHGVTKDVETTGTLKVNGGKIDANSTFNVLISDYNIKIPAVVKDKVSNTIKITVDCDLEPLKS